MKVDLLNMVQTVSLGVEKIRPVIIAYITDETVSWRDRWEVYSKIPAYMFEVSPWYEPYEIGGIEILWYDDHYIERRQTADNIEIINRYEEYSGSDLRLKFSAEKIDQLKQDMLKSGIRTWVNDW